MERYGTVCNRSRVNGALVFWGPEIQLNNQITKDLCIESRCDSQGYFEDSSPSLFFDLHDLSTDMKFLTRIEPRGPVTQALNQFN